MWLVSLAVACGARPPAPVAVVGKPAVALTTPARATGPTCTAPALVALHGSYHFGSHRREVGGDVCQPADDNLARAEDAILALPPPHRVAGTKRGAAIGLELIDRRFGLTATERAHLAREGFVVPARLEQPSYAWAYHEIYQSQLPIFISVDSVLHALYATHDHLLAGIERKELQPKLVAMVAALHCALAAQHYAPELARDLDLYLTVARRLLENRDVPSALGEVDREAGALVAELLAAGPMRPVALFGRARMLDFSQFAPRGHYTEELAPYFRGFMWLSRLEFNLVSRSSRSSAPDRDASETPREELVALGLAQLVASAHEDAHLNEIDRMLSVLAGRREDVSVPQLLALEITLHDTHAAEHLRAAIGERFQRTARIHYMPEGSTTLPAIATLLGPRVVADTLALRPLAHGETPQRQRVRAGDLAYLAGNDRGKTYLADDLARFPTLAAQLDKARELVQTAPRTLDLYTRWLDAIRALAIVPAGARPTFMTTAAYADLRLDTTIAAFAQLRHDHVLIAGQAYGEGGCEIPDGYVEPAPEVYDAIARYAELGAAALGGDYFPRLGKLARVLAAISRIELANQPLPPVAKQWLGMVTEILPYGSDGRPTYSGWYFDLFDDRSDAIAHADLVADYFTSDAGVAYVGVRAPSLGIFVVDTGGAPRAMIGPVAHAYEYASAATPRLDDRAAAQVTGIEDPWIASYTVPAPREPNFRAGPSYEWTDAGAGFLAIDFDAKEDLGMVTVQALDHHRLPLGKPVTQRIGRGATHVRIAPNTEDGPHADLVSVRIGAFSAAIEMRCMDGCASQGFGTERAPATSDAE